MSPKHKPGSGWVPKLTWHKGPDGKDRGRVRLNGVDHYLGDRDDPDTLQRYRTKVAEWLGNDQAKPVDSSALVTVAELLAAFLRHAEDYYQKRGKPTAEVWCYRRIISIILATPYAELPAADFGAEQLRAIRAQFLQQTYQSGKTKRRWTRGNVNEQTNRVRRIWSWGHAHMGVPLVALQSMREVRGLAKTRTTAPEGRKVLPVTREQLDRTMKVLPGCLPSLVMVHSLIGCRMDEICVMRPCDLDKSDAGVWKYSPSEYKTEHVDKPIDSHYWIGPRAQKLLEPLVAKCKKPTDWVFPLMKTVPGRGCYNRSTYLHAVKRAIERVNKKEPDNPLITWSPRQIRHLRLSEIKLLTHQLGRDGQEAAQAVAGHAEPSTTAIYAELSDVARETMRELG